MRARARRVAPALVAWFLATGAAAQDGPATGQLVIVTEPPGARVLVDGREVGTSPTTVAELVPGAHLIAAANDGGARAERVVEVEAGRSILVSLALEIAAPDTVGPATQPAPSTAAPTEAAAPSAAASPTAAAAPTETASPTEAAEMAETQLSAPVVADTSEHVIDEPIAATGFPGLLGVSIGARLDVPIYVEHPVRLVFDPMRGGLPGQDTSPIATARLSFEVGIDPAFGALAAIDLGSGAFGLGAAANIPGYIPVSREIAIALQPRLAGLVYYHPAGAFLLSVEAALRVGVSPIPHLVIGGELGLIVLGALPLDGAGLVIPEGAYVGPILGGGVEWTFY